MKDPKTCGECTHIKDFFMWTSCVHPLIDVPDVSGTYTPGAVHEYGPPPDWCPLLIGGSIPADGSMDGGL